MNSYWPDGLELSDIQSPMEILESAREDWDTSSDGVLTLVLQEARSETNNNMIIVHAKHVPSGRTTTLFSVVHRPNAPYPASIQLKQVDLPDCLKKSYYDPGPFYFTSLMTTPQGRTVTNDWVSDTPSEFRTKLKKVFNLGATKMGILSLVSNTPVIDANGTEEATEKQTGED